MRGMKQSTPALPLRRGLVGLLVVSFVGLMACAPDSSFAQTPAPASVSHADVFKAMGSGADDKVKQLIVGKTYEGKLIHTSPTHLMANFGDGVYFACDSGSVAKSGGAVKSTIKGYETLPSGESLVRLASCAPA